MNASLPVPTRSRSFPPRPAREAFAANRHGWGVALLLLLGLDSVQAQPDITLQPADRSVSVGATETFRVIARSTHGPLSYQWWRGDLPRVDATNATLTLTNIQTTDAGLYSVVIADPTGTTPSRSATLDVDATFTKVTHDPSVELSASTFGCAFGDFDDDGFLDLYVANHSKPRNCLYRNLGNGTFTEVRTGLWSNNREMATGGVWGDYDNDGRPDLLVAPYDLRLLALYANLGDASFTNLPASQVGLIHRGDFMAAAWADIESDGFLDFVAVEYNGRCSLYRNDRQGGFTRQPGTGLPTGSKAFHACTWSDYDRDGRPDLFITVYGESGLLFHNSGDGAFTPVTARPPGVANADFVSASWGDYDNDGDPDLFIASGGYVSRQRSLLYHGEPGAGFLPLTRESLDAVSHGVSGSWADYDNDGFLDLFVCNALGEDNALFHNDGDGTFTPVVRGSPVHDGAHSVNGIWGDVNNDGFLDLYVANGGSEGAQVNFLYLNHGNRNAWLMLRLVGTVSNRSAIGAKVEVQATVRGQPLRQSREVSGGTGWCAQNDPRVHFGLGDATVAERIRIEWPSGIVQELRQIPARQILTVTEPARLEATSPGRFRIHSWKGMAFDVQSAANLPHWSEMGAVTNVDGTLEVTDSAPLSTTSRFYRVRQR